MCLWKLESHKYNEGPGRVTSFLVSYKYEQEPEFKYRS
jgi:hypothetical protein